MRALLQRVSAASVSVESKVVGQIDAGLLIFICAMPDDTETTTQTLAAKIAKLRILKDDAGKMNRSLSDTGGSALIVSQFTLAADTTRGTRPGFSRAAQPEKANALYQHFITSIAALGIPTQSGVFGADMSVSITNEGPVTLWIDTERT